MTSVIGKLPQFARKSGNVKWYCSSSVWANVLERLALAANGSAYAGHQGRADAGISPASPSRSLRSCPRLRQPVSFASLRQHYRRSTTFGDRRGVTVKMTDSNDTDFESDLHAVKVTERFDVNAHDVGDTSVAGPDRRPQARLISERGINGRGSCSPSYKIFARKEK
jgi:hypothetical protein